MMFSWFAGLLAGPEVGDDVPHADDTSGQESNKAKDKEEHVPEEPEVPLSKIRPMDDKVDDWWSHQCQRRRTDCAY